VNLLQIATEVFNCCLMMCLGVWLVGGVRVSEWPISYHDQQQLLWTGW